MAYSALLSIDSSCMLRCVDKEEGSIRAESGRRSRNLLDRTSTFVVFRDAGIRPWPLGVSDSLKG
jgi:hypothetical protein